MEPNIATWEGVLVQIPLVAAFIWFSIRMVKDFTSALERRDALYEERNQALVKAIEANTEQLIRLTEMICAQAGRPTPRRGASD